MNRVQMLQAAWMGHRKVLLSLLEVIPADQVSYAPWAGAMSLGDLAIHTADDFFYRFVQTGEPSRRAKPEWKTLDDVKQVVQERTDSIQSVFGSLTDADLDKVLEVTQMSLKGPGAMYIGIAKDHEIHHKGQLFVYARLIGLKELPFFVARG